MNELEKKDCISVVIPCYKVKKSILQVISNIGSEISNIYIIDDSCPENSGQYVNVNCLDKRVQILYHKTNMGVGAAVKTGYKKAINDGAKIIIKIDGDGQMDPKLISNFIEPIIKREADYTKGNRFFYIEGLRTMPNIRLFGNAILSLITKLSSGYWNLFDPTNGFTAIHTDVAQRLPFEKIDNRYFFEMDILFRLNTLRAVVIDIPMNAKYGNEKSNLQISKIIFEFLIKSIRNFFKRIFYNYYLRDMSLASIELPLGLSLFIFGSIFGISQWFHSFETNLLTSTGTVMLAVLPILIGLQLILAFLNYDIVNIPNKPVHKK